MTAPAAESSAFSRRGFDVRSTVQRQRTTADPACPDSHSQCYSRKFVMNPQPISKEGYDKIRDEIRELDEVQRPAVSERIKLAREEGDLSENVEYHSAREQQGYIQAKVRQLRTKLAGCRIVDKSEMPKGVVCFGSCVTVKDLSDGMEEQYELVGPGEEDYDCDVVKILTSSPIAQAMIGKKVGEQFEAEVPVGTLNLEITAIDDSDE